MFVALWLFMLQMTASNKRLSALITLLIFSMPLAGA